MPAALWHCPHCGAEIQTGAQFCDHCGVRLEEPAAQSRAQRAPSRIGIALVVLSVIASSMALAGRAGTRATAVTDRAPAATWPVSLALVGARVGQPAPGFTLRNSNGREVDLGGFRGHPVIINFWASWCTYCRVEMPDLDALYREESGRQGLVVLAVDTEDSDRLAAEALVLAKAFSFTVLWDEDDRVANRYGVRGLPTSVFVDRDGTIRAVNPGAMRREEMNEKAKWIY